MLQRGYVQTTIDEIAKEARLSKGSVYWHFASKEEVLLALAAATWERALVDLRAFLDQKTSLRAAFEQTGRGMDASHGSAGLYRLYLEFWAMGDLSSALRRELHAHQQLQEELIAGRLRQAVKAGEIGPHIDPSLIAKMISALFDGFAVRRQFDRKFDLGAAWTQAMRALFRGLAPK